MEYFSSLFHVKFEEDKLLLCGSMEEFKEKSKRELILGEKILQNIAVVREKYISGRRC